ncbi:hypothetical protein [Streptomyces sp. NPDC026589]|uniref:hypothetical protein n=1 Tax=Streptomyces sp. NPDC026589 TaxID=3155609 RepID=UPI0033E8E0FC
MHPLNLPEQVDQLRSLAQDFEAMSVRVRDVYYTPGTDALRKIRPLLLRTQYLTTATLIRLGALDSSAYTSIPGSQASLECLASVVFASSLAGTDLANALHANPYEGAPFPGYPADSASVRTARHAEAIPKMTGHLADAVRHLDLSATGCHYVATGIARDLTTAREATTTAAQRKASPDLSGTQYDALKTFSLGASRLYETRPGMIRVYTDSGDRVSMATYEALAKRELVDRDTSTSLFRGQRIAVTEEGQRALAGPRPAAKAAAPAKAAPKASGVPGAHR